MRNALKKYQLCVIAALVQSLAAAGAAAYSSQPPPTAVSNALDAGASIEFPDIPTGCGDGDVNCKYIDNRTAAEEFKIPNYNKTFTVGSFSTKGVAFYRDFNFLNKSFSDNTKSDSGHVVILGEEFFTRTSSELTFQVLGFSTTYAFLSNSDVNNPEGKIDGNGVYISVPKGETLTLTGGGYISTEYFTPGTGAVVGALLGTNSIVYEKSEEGENSYETVGGGKIELTNSTAFIQGIDGGAADDAATVGTGFVSGAVLLGVTINKDAAAVAANNNNAYINNVTLDFYTDEKHDVKETTWSNSIAMANRGVLGGLTILAPGAMEASTFAQNKVTIDGAVVVDAWRIGGVVNAVISSNQMMAAAQDNAAIINKSEIAIRSFEDSAPVNGKSSIGNYDYALIAGVDKLMNDSEGEASGNKVVISNSTVENVDTGYKLHIAGAYLASFLNQGNSVSISNSTIHSTSGGLYAAATMRDDSSSLLSIDGESVINVPTVAGTYVEVNNKRSYFKEVEEMAYSLRGTKVEVSGGEESTVGVGLNSNALSVYLLDYRNYKTSVLYTAEKSRFDLSDGVLLIENAKIGTDKIGVLESVVSGSSSSVDFSTIATTYNINDNNLIIGPGVSDSDGGRLTLEKLSLDISDSVLANHACNASGNTVQFFSPVTTKSFSGFDNWVFVYGGDALTDLATPALLVNGTEKTQVNVGAEGADGTITVVLNNMELNGKTVLVQNAEGFTDAAGAELTQEALDQVGAEDLSLMRYRSLALLENLSAADVDLLLEDNVDAEGNAGSDGVLDSIVIPYQEPDPDPGTDPDPHPDPRSGNESPFGEVFSQQSLSRLTTLIASDDLLIDTLSSYDYRNGNFFAAARYNSIRFDTGSNVKDRTFSSLVGTGMPLTDQITAGVFFEAGTSDVDTAKSSAIGSIDGEGDNDYYGVGLFLAAQSDAASGPFGRAYMKLGRLESDFSVDNSTTGRLSNSTDHLYAGANLTAGWRFALTENQSVQVQASYYYDYLKSDSFRLKESNGAVSTIDADDAEVHRLEVMSRWVGSYDGFAPFAGIGVESILSSSAGGSVRSVNIDGTLANIPFVESDIEGESAIAEIGAALVRGGWTFKAHLKGYAGQREGAAGSFDVKYVF